MTGREQLPKQYTVGDVVTIRVEIEHEMHLRKVQMVFVPDNGEEHDFVLTDTPKLMYTEQSYFGKTKRSVADAKGIVHPNLTPGIYHLRSITLTTIGNTSYLLNEGGDFVMVGVRSLKVVEEPKSKPRITSAYYPARK